MPARSVIEVEERLGAAGDVDQLPAIAVLVARHEAHEEVASAEVEDDESAEQGILGQAGALLEQISLALEQDDRPREGDEQEKGAVEGEAVVGDGPERDTAAQGEAVLHRVPFAAQIGDTDDRALVPPGAAIEVFEPLLVGVAVRVQGVGFGALVGRHLDGHETGDAIEAEAGGPQRDAGR